MTISSYISKYAPIEDNNDPVAYSKNFVAVINKELLKSGKKITVTTSDTLGTIKEILEQAGLDPEHTFTKAHLSTEDPSVLKALNFS